MLETLLKPEIIRGALEVLLFIGIALGWIKAKQVYAILTGLITAIEMLGEEDKDGKKNLLGKIKEVLPERTILNKTVAKVKQQRN